MSMRLALLIYALAMTLANLAVAKFGPSITGLTAFIMIGLDLALRDWLHEQLKTWQMASLISGTGLITFLLNPAAGMIAIASAIAFTAAAIVDWLSFATLRGPWLFRANGSNLSGAVVDSLLFPYLAFGAWLPGTVISQLFAKLLGGAIWAYLLYRYLNKRDPARSA